MLTQHDRERAEEGRAAELPDPQARARVRRRDERAAPRRLQVPARDPRGPRHVRRRPARSSTEVVERLVAEYTPGDVFEDWDLGRARRCQRRAALAARRRRSPSSTRRRSNREEITELLTEDALARLRRARGGVRRRADALARAPDPAADHRQPLARAPLRDGLPARGHPPPRLRPDRPARRLQERGLHDVRGADGRDLGGVRAADLPRRGQGRARRGRGAVFSAAEAPSRGPVLGRRPPSSPRRSREAGAARRAGARDARPAAARRSRSRRRGPAGTAAPAQQQSNTGTVVKTEQEKIGRNDPCWCGSGKKYKKCHGGLSRRGCQRPRTQSAASSTLFNAERPRRARGDCSTEDRRDPGSRSGTCPRPRRGPPAGRRRKPTAHLHQRLVLDEVERATGAPWSPSVPPAVAAGATTGEVADEQRSFGRRCPRCATVASPRWRRLRRRAIEAHRSAAGLGTPT